MRMANFWIGFIVVQISTLMLCLLLPENVVGWIVLSALAHFALFIFFQNAHKLQSQRELTQIQQQAALQAKNLNVQSKQLSTIVSNLPFPIALLDLKGYFILLNDQFRQLYNSDKELLHYDQMGFHVEVRQFMRQAYLKESFYTKALKLGVKDYQAINVPIYDNNRYSGCLLMFLDVTQVLDGERMQKRFIADASHELKTPLTAILGMVQILNRPDFNDREALLEFLPQIEHESQRMDSILQDLLLLSKLSAQKMPLNLNDVNLQALIMKSYQTLKQQFTDEDNTFNCDVDEKLWVRVDQDKFHQILTNLFSNALKFTSHGTISIKAELSQTQLILILKDSGVGIKLEDQPYIFDRFFRSDVSRARKSGGSGLGLAIVKSFVLAHKGEIRVESQPNQGTTFILSFPSEIVNKS